VDHSGEVLPTIDEVCEGMSVSLVIKDVTWETLNNGEFVEWLKEKYKHSKELRQPFESYTAARGRTVTPSVVSKQLSGGRCTPPLRCFTKHPILSLNATTELVPVMNADDLCKGLAKVAQKIKLASKMSGALSATAIDINY
jgi:hypothetical protein